MIALSGSEVRGMSGQQRFPDLNFELELWQAGLLRVAGADEAGRGALAGPVAAAVVVLPPSPQIAGQLWGVRDSKQMTPRQRQEWAAKVRLVALDHGVGMASAEEIDALGIVPATCLALQRALSCLHSVPQHLMLDYLNYPDHSLPKTVLVKGDARCLSIAAASILAKTERDAWMVAAEQQYPGYGFSRHKGYGSPQHIRALKELGPCPLHRRTFRPKQLKSSSD